MLLWLYTPQGKVHWLPVPVLYINYIVFHWPVDGHKQYGLVELVINTIMYEGVGQSIHDVIAINGIL